MSKAFWATVRQQIAELRTATSADDVIRILGPDRNPYGPSFEGAAGDGFYAGGDAGDPWDALDDAGWSHVWSSPKPGEGHCFYVMRAPNGDRITYCEGDIYRGDKRPENGS